MIPFNVNIDFEHVLMSNFKESVMAENVFIERLNNWDYAVYNDESKRILWLQFAKRQETDNNQHSRFLHAIETQYTTHLACSFNPDDVSGLVAIVEKAYKKQQENELKNKDILAKNKKRAEEIKNKNYQPARFEYLENLCR